MDSRLSSHFFRLRHRYFEKLQEKGHTVPTYQYACAACDHAFEAFQSFADAPLTECPECKGELRKVYSTVGIVFKGSGFYKTDSVSKPATASE